MKRIDFVAMESETPEVPVAAAPVETPAEVPVETPAPAEPVVADNVVAEVPAEAANEVPAEVPAVPAAEVPAEETPAATPAEAAPVAVEAPAAMAAEIAEAEVTEIDDDEVGMAAMLVDDETMADFQEQEETNAALESLSMYASNIEYLIATEGCTAATADLITFGVQQQLNRLGDTIPAISLESITDVVEQHRVALEGIREGWKRWAQSYVLNVKHSYMIFFDALRSKNGLIVSGEKKLVEAENEYRTDKANYTENSHEGSLVELWYHFSNDKGQTIDVIPAISKDLELSKYVLKTYPTELLSLLGKLTNIVHSGKAASLKDVASLAKRIESLSHPADVFRRALVGNGHPFLSVTGLEMNQGTQRNTITIGKDSFVKLAALATPRVVNESWNGKHVAKKVGSVVGRTLAGLHLGTSIVAQAANAAAPESITLTTAEIGELFTSAREYLDNVKGYIAMADSFSPAIDAFGKAMERLVATVGEELQPDEVNQIQVLIKQVEQYASNIILCLKKPATQEVARSLKGSKYCRYLGLRMLSNAK